MAQIEDYWGGTLFECSYAGVRIDVKTIRTNLGREIARHKYKNVSGADLEDGGGEPRQTDCRILFMPLRDDKNPRERFDAFVRFKDDGRAHPFVHPIFGSYQARVDNFDVSAHDEERNMLSVDCSFVEDTVVQAVFETPGAGFPALSGLDEVDAAASVFDQALLDVGVALGKQLQSTIGASIRETVRRWVEG